MKPGAATRMERGRCQCKAWRPRLCSLPAERDEHLAPANNLSQRVTLAELILPAIGRPRRRRQLLRTVGSLSGVRRVTREELRSIVGAKVAEAVR
jgi:hypothetical protein